MVATGYLFTRVPTSFLPDEDQGVMMMQVTLPANASSERTQQVLDEIQLAAEERAGSQLGVFAERLQLRRARGKHRMSFVLLKPWAQR